MFTLIFSAIILGAILSFILIGPVFFMLIEMSLLKGVKAAMIMDLGVISSDIVCIILAYYSSREISVYIQAHPSIFKIDDIIIFIYGCVMLHSKNNLHFKNGIFHSNNNLFRFFIKGFFINFMNIGIVVFWISVVLVILDTYSHIYEFFLYISIVLSTVFILDLLKISLISKFHYKFKRQMLYKIRRIFGILLIISSLFLFIKSFFSILSIEKDLPFRVLRIPQK